MSKADTQTSLRLPMSLRDRLAEAADAAGHGLGEEIRERLELSFENEPPRDADYETQVLLLAIKDMASLLEDHYPAWHADAFSFQALAAAISKLLRLYRPEGEPEPKPKAREALFNEKATVDGVSALLVGSASRGLLGARWPS